MQDEKIIVDVFEIIKIEKMRIFFNDMKKIVGNNYAR